MRLAEKESCTGCGACVNICPVEAIGMKRDDFGFLYPDVVGKCIECGKCERVCPVLSEAHASPELNEVYAAYAVDEGIRADSSSGGVFSLLANGILANRGSVYGACYDSDYSVIHICVEKPEDLYRLRGAKYAQSDIGYCFRDVRQKLAEGREVLFSGTPCQVAALHTFLGRNHEKLLLVDMVCHSVPSPLAWNNYVRYRAKQDNDGLLPIKINLRSKHTGWSHYTYSNLYEYGGGKKCSALSGEDPYMRMFVGGYISRESCAVCRFKGLERISDITLGDLWGAWDFCPEMDDNKGTSLLLVHSEKGAESLRSIQPELRMKKIPTGAACSYNPAICKAYTPGAKRSSVISAAAAGEFDAALRELDEKRGSFLRRILKRIKRWARRETTP